MDRDAQINAYFDNVLPAEEARGLVEWLRESPDHLNRFVRAAHMHRLLIDHFRSEGRIELLTGERLPSRGDSRAPELLDEVRLYKVVPGGPAAGAPAKPAVALEEAAPVGRAEGFAVWRYAAALFLMAAALSIYLLWPRWPGARLLAVENAVWKRGAAMPSVGDRLAAGERVLENGLIKVGFDNGNVVVIEGPARFSMQGELRIELHSGRLSALVSEQGQGLRVTTGNSTITDLGTEFSVGTTPDKTDVLVYKGKITAAPGEDQEKQEMIAVGDGVVLSKGDLARVELPAIETTFRRALAADTVRLGMVDLLAGGDGRGKSEGFGIDAATGLTGRLAAVDVRRGDGQYVPIDGHPLLDGCFVPAGTMPIDSAGHTFTFQMTRPLSQGLIWAGANIPWATQPPPNMALKDELPDRDPSQVLVVPSNNGFTLNLEALRRMHPGADLLNFRARVGNGSQFQRVKASVHVIVDGQVRGERLGFTNEDPSFDLVSILTAKDQYLTLVTTDGGDHLGWDWVLWTNACFEVRKR